MKQTRYLLLLILFFSLLIGGSQSEAYAQRKVKVSTLSVMNEGKPYTVHTYRRREALEDIAKAYGVELSEIYGLNPTARRGVKHGDTLLIPIAGFDYSDKEEEEIELHDTVPEEVVLPDMVFGSTAPVSRTGELNVALLLPFERGGSNIFVQFYNGVLMAMEELTQRGAKISLKVISTDRSVQRAQDIISSGELEGMNLIIGPVYAEEFAVVAEWGGRRQIPVISPLGATEELANPYVVGIAPPARTQWDGFRALVGDTSKNVIAIEHMTLMDRDMMRSLDKSLSPMVRRVPYADKNTDIESIGDLLVRGVENVVVVAVDNEIAVEEILSRLSSYNAAGRYRIRVVGSNSWARFTKLNLDLFFKLEVSFPTSYYYDYLDDRVAPVHSRYISNYRSEPSLYSMRGYDVAMLAAGTLYKRGEDMMYALLEGEIIPLQSPYEFSPISQNGILQNTHWPIVTYHSNYSIEVF
ncbi:MAG: ABC transporter substrate-binding protein [Rikenellaceae bacterium]